MSKPGIVVPLEADTLVVILEFDGNVLRIKKIININQPAALLCYDYLDPTI